MTHQKSRIELLVSSDHGGDGEPIQDEAPAGLTHSGLFDRVLQ
jgi:hypothetical protein